MKENAIKAVIAILIAGAMAYFKELIGPLIVLGVVMVVDYVTGISAAWVSKELSSRVGLIGIVKKLAYLAAVGVAVVIDYIIQQAIIKVGVELNSIGVYFGLIVTVWLILNECLSILENLAEIGVPLPKFLLSAVERLKKTTEKAGEDAAQEIKPPEDASLPEHGEGKEE